AAGMTGLYFLKKDSADGRLLIWQCTWNMIRDKPVTGHGYGTFNARYMLYQAEYFEMHPGSKYAYLADNVLHPFNEYLLVWAEHGMIGVGGVVLLCFLLLRRYFREPSHIRFIALLGLLSPAVLSCFSYPFRYPFTWLIALLHIALICSPGKAVSRRTVNATRTGLVLTATTLLLAAVPLMKAEIRWNRIAHLSLAGKTGEVLPEYDQLYRYLGKDGLFLYNHAAELHEVQEYAKSLSVFEQCVRYYNDMDVQMLLADNYKELHQYGEAEKHLKLATFMCPARFMPLYELAKLYETAGRHTDALTVARQIIDKKIKIPSATVTAIKNEMRQLLEKEENRDSATRGGTSDESKNHEPRQGETLEVSPHGSALPP
ncbi:MAG: O-antigen ligase family protein, partial [Prevotellaceae bacterium]|nr:O-antigen ligase family protein [Prevotellaceae bacterium]